MKYALIYLVAVNIISMIVCIVDKNNAINGRWRVPEKRLFMLSIIGGSVMMYATMRIIRHKTLHKRFMIGLPVIIILQIAAVILVSKYNLLGNF